VTCWLNARDGLAVKHEIAPIARSSQRELQKRMQLQFNGIEWRYNLPGLVEGIRLIEPGEYQPDGATESR
jgi:hypothetical protein